MARLARGEKLLESEVQQLERAVDGYDNYSSILQSNTVLGGKDLNIPLPFNVIYSTILDTDVASLEFTIPGNYKHLMIMGQGRLNGTGGQSATFLYAQFNGDTGSNYIIDLLYQSASTHGVVEDLSNVGVAFTDFVADGGAAYYNGTFVAYIPHYNSAYYKTILSHSGVTYGTATTETLWQGMWKDVSPIQSIRIIPNPTYASAKIEAGSLISVYGIV